MKMISSTRITSTIGVMLMSLLSPPDVPTFIPMAVTPCGRRSSGAARLVPYSDDADAAETGLVDHSHQAAHLLVLEPTVGLDDHFLVRRGVVGVLELRFEMVVGNPVLSHEDAAIGLYGH